MIVEVSMKMDEEKFHVHSWWATSPQFALGALARQLDAAKTIWPEYLGGYELAKVRPDSPEPPHPEVKTGHAVGNEFPNGYDDEPQALALTK